MQNVDTLSLILVSFVGNCPLFFQSLLMSIFLLNNLHKKALITQYVN